MFYFKTAIKNINAKVIDISIVIKLFFFKSMNSYNYFEVNLKTFKLL